jgi:hypothetical protein
MNCDLKLLNAVLGLEIGQALHVPEKYLRPGMYQRGHTIHRYRAGWLVLLDKFHSRGISRELLGWEFCSVEDMTDFMTGQLGARSVNFRIVGAA